MGAVAGVVFPPVWIMDGGGDAPTELLTNVEGKNAADAEDDG